jgi:hypothetical protein
MGNLASAIDELAACDLDAMPGPVLLAEITELLRQRDRLNAVYLRMLERADRTGAVLSDHGSSAAFLRTAARMSPQHAHRDVHLTRDLTDSLPGTAAALADGDISVEHAQVMTALTRLSDDIRADVEPHLVDFARRATPQELRRAVDHTLHRFTSAKDQAGDDQDDYAQRRLHATRGIHGNGLGDWQLHPVGHETVMTAIHALSKPIPGDDRTAAQRRADALITLAEHYLNAGHAPTRGGVKPHVTVVVGHDTLQGTPGSPAAEYTYGTTASSLWARRTACDATISRIITNPTGDILDAGRATRTFTAAQLRAIIARDNHCIWPGCDTPPGWCDAHHRIHWANGGPTSVTNGTLLCGRHHDRVHLHGHAIIQGPGRYQVDLRPGTDPHWHGPPQRAGP